MNDVDNKVKMIIEGLLLAAGRPLSLASIAAVFAEDERPDDEELLAVLERIDTDCIDRGFELSKVATGYRFQVKQELSEWIAKLWEERPPRYTRALLETLGLIAYRQPITRGDIEEIRAVAVSSTLSARCWIANGSEWWGSATFRGDLRCLPRLSNFWTILISRAYSSCHRFLILRI